MHHSLLDRWNATSLRNKITGVTVLLLTLGLLIGGAGTMIMFKPVLISMLDNQLRAAAVAGIINANIPTSDQPDGTVAGDGSVGNYFVALYNGHGELLSSNWNSLEATARPEIPTTLSLAQGALCSSQGAFDLHSSDGRIDFRGVCTVVAFTNDNPTPKGTAIVATSTRQIDAVMASYLSIFLGFSIIVVVIGAVLARMLVGSTFGPLREAERTAAAIAEGDFSQRLADTTPNTEVGRLNRSLNTMLNRIDRAFRDRAHTIDQMRRFVGDASHELRTPLVSVRGYAELYRMGALEKPDDVAQAMERIEKEAIRMSGLVENLLQLARLDETKPLELVTVDLLPLAKDAALDANAAHPDRTVTVTTSLPALKPLNATVPAPETEEDVDSTDTPPGGTGPISFAGATLARLRRKRPRRNEVGEETMPLQLDEIPKPPTMRPLVMAEENKLRQVLNNLIGNAVRYTPEHTPLEIGVVVDVGAQRARLDVIDHGDGIPPQIRDKIFQRFWRADTSRTRETGGSGLGLAIVSSIVAAHNGSVEVVETPGGGSTFRVSLPLADSANAPQSLAPTP